MYETGQELRDNNEKIVQLMAILKRQRDEMGYLIEKQVTEKSRIQNEIEKLSFKLTLLTKSLSQRVHAKTNYDKTIREIEEHYTSLVVESGRLLNNINKEVEDLEQIMDKKTETTGSIQSDKGSKGSKSSKGSNGSKPTNQSRRNSNQSDTRKRTSIDVQHGGSIIDENVEEEEEDEENEESSEDEMPEVRSINIDKLEKRVSPSIKPLQKKGSIDIDKAEKPSSQTDKHNNGRLSIELASEILSIPIDTHQKDQTPDTSIPTVPTEDSFPYKMIDPVAELYSPHNENDSGNIEPKNSKNSDQNRSSSRRSSIERNIKSSENEKRNSKLGTTNHETSATSEKESRSIRLNDPKDGSITSARPGESAPHATFRNDKQNDVSRKNSKTILEERLQHTLNKSPNRLDETSPSKTTDKPNPKKPDSVGNRTPNRSSLNSQSSNPQDWRSISDTVQPTVDKPDDTHQNSDTSSVILESYTYRDKNKIEDEVQSYREAYGRQHSHPPLPPRKPDFDKKNRKRSS